MSNIPWLKCNFVVVDVEGNGQTPQEIIEISIIPVSDNKIGTPSSWLIKPKKPVTERVTNIHGITDKNLLGCPSSEEVAKEIKAVLGNSIVVGHNVIVDTKLMRNEFGDWFPVAIIDTLKLAKYVRPGLESYSLDSLINIYNLKINPLMRHRASGDAQVTAELFLALISNLDEDFKIDLLALSQIAGSLDDPFIKNQQRSLF